MPLLSVIIPVYNVERFLDQCVESVLGQTLTDLEVILVDDGSPDRCPAICDAYAARDPRVKVVHKQNGGLGFARNSGLDVATGRYVTFIDSDDYIAKGAYERLTQLMEKESLDEIRFIARRFRDDDHITEEKYVEQFTLYEDEETKKLALTIFDNYLPASAKTYDIGGSACMAVYKRSVIEHHKLRFHSEKEFLSEDLFFNFEFYLHCNKVGYLPNRYYFYRINNSSISMSFSTDRPRRAAESAQFLINVFEDYGLDKDTYLNALGFYLSVLRRRIRQWMHSPLSLREKRRLFQAEINRKFYFFAMDHYPASRLTSHHRLLHETIRLRSFWLTYLVCKLWAMALRQ